MLPRASLLATIAIALLAAPAAAKRLPDTQQDDLAGKIGSVLIEIERTVDGAPRRQKLELLTYNGAGDLTEREVYTDGALSAKLTYAYDTTGVRRITSSTRDGAGIGLPPTRLRPRENPASTAVPTADGKFSFSAVYSYTAGGRILDERIYAGTDTSKTAVPLAHTAMKIGPSGIVMERLVFSGSPEKTVSRETFSYGEDGRLSESFRYGPSNALPVKTTYAYQNDPRGNWIARTETTMISGKPVVTVRHRTITYSGGTALAPK